MNVTYRTRQKLLVKSGRWWHWQCTLVPKSIYHTHLTFVEKHHVIEPTVSHLFYRHILNYLVFQSFYFEHT